VQRSPGDAPSPGADRGIREQRVQVGQQGLHFRRVQYGGLDEK
jgi:hypothetical protein